MLRPRNATSQPITADAPAPADADAPTLLPDLIAQARRDADAAILADPMGKVFSEQLATARRAEATAKAALADLQARYSTARDKKLRAASVDAEAERLLAGESATAEIKPPTEAEFVAARHAVTVAQAAVSLGETRLRGLRVAAEREAVIRLFVPARAAAERRTALTLARLLTENDRLLEAIGALEAAGFGQSVVRRTWQVLPLLGHSRERFSAASGLLREAVEMGVVTNDELRAALDYFGGERLLDYRSDSPAEPPAAPPVKPRRAGPGPMPLVAVG